MKILEKSSSPIAETLAGMYNTNVPFLEGNAVPVIKRMFNWIPTGGAGDPPRALTDLPPLKTHFYEQHSVLSDFPKTMAYRRYGDGFAQMPDGTYRDMVMGVNRDNEELQKAYKQVFAPSDVYMFMRADRENYTEEMIRDYFRSKYEERAEREELFLRDYGLSPLEVQNVMAQRKVQAAAEALNRARTSNRLPVQQVALSLRKEDLIADRFMNNGLPLFSVDDRRGVGNAQPWAIGHEDYTRGQTENPEYARATPRRGHIPKASTLVENLSPADRALATEYARQRAQLTDQKARSDILKDFAGRIGETPTNAGKILANIVPAKSGPKKGKKTATGGGAGTE